MGRRVAREEPEIFNFSFLDILACTVGALAFILTILLVTVRGSFSRDKVVQQAIEELEELRDRKSVLVATRDRLQTEQSSLEESIVSLSGQADQTEQDAVRVTAEVESLAKKVNEASRRAAQLRELAELDQQRQELSTQLTAMKMEIDKLASQKVANSEEYRLAVEARDKNRELQKTVAEVTGRLKDRQTQNSQYQEMLDEIARLNAELAELPTQIAENQQAISEAKAAKALLEEQAGDTQLARPPWVLLIVAWGIALTLFVWWLRKRMSRPRGSVEDLQAVHHSTSNKIQELLTEIESRQAELQDRKNQIAASPQVRSGAGDISRVKTEADDAARLAKEAQAEAAELRQRLQNVRQQKSTARQQADRARNGRGQVVPRAIDGPGGTSRRPTHVECRSDGLLIHPGRQRVGESQISASRSPYGTLIREIAKAKKDRCLVLWIRPDGYSNFEKARNAAMEVKAGVGWEPADSDWDFLFD
ncbi:hypothetical protein [Thalassoroseus pseudoceratinae]|uniref:hypothetical protein n=1 Tax=Thalassoroseus pseudoceratinae TaxID=2713176 RepID=UPI0014217D61|nr:hypothetical protein [Thalassoroseus pseudoceratinae]